MTSPLALPQKITIGNRTVAVQVGGVPDDLMGFYDGKELRIALHEKLSRPQMVETLWHETIHAIFDYLRFSSELQMELNDGDSLEFDAFRFEERMTEGFSKVLLQVINDNKLDTVM